MNPEQKSGLTRIIMADVLRSANLGRRKIIVRLINLVGQPAAGWLAALLVRIDEQLGESSITETTIRAIHAFSDGFSLSQQEEVPLSGPLLVVSNHPGMGDIIGVLASLGRKDVKIVAQRKEFMRVLGNINRYMLPIEDDKSLKFETIRQIVQALRDGMAVIIFPSGSLEPDPALMAGAVASLKSWSESVGVFLNKVPEARLLPVLVSAVVTPRAWNSRFAKLGKTQKRRHQLAMAAEFIMQRLSKKEDWKQPMRLDMGKAKFATKLDPTLDPRRLTKVVRAEMQRLIEQLPTSSGKQP